MEFIHLHGQSARTQAGHASVCQHADAPWALSRLTTQCYMSSLYSSSHATRGQREVLRYTKQEPAAKQGKPLYLACALRVDLHHCGVLCLMQQLADLIDEMVYGVLARHG